MGRSGSISDLAAVDAWKIPLFVGLASVPITTLLLWLDAGTYAVLTPAFFAGLVVGYLFRERPAGSGRVGWRTGLIGGLALVLPMLDFATLIPGRFPHAVIGIVVGIAFAFFAALYVVFFGVVGAIGGAIGDRVAERVAGSRSFAATQ